MSAVMNVIGGLAGSAIVLYAVNAAWPARSVRATLQVCGLGLNFVATAFTNGKVTEDKVGPHTDFLTEFPSLGAPHNAAQT